MDEERCSAGLLIWNSKCLRNLENEVIFSMNLTFRDLQFPLVSFKFTQPGVSLLAACEWADLKCCATPETPALSLGWGYVNKVDSTNPLDVDC
jgi:hypothetical protein